MLRDRSTAWGTHVRLDTPVRITRKIQFVPRYQKYGETPFKMEKRTPRPGDTQSPRRQV